MTDDLAKYEALRERIAITISDLNSTNKAKGLVLGALSKELAIRTVAYAEALDELTKSHAAITELVAMVREARELNKMQHQLIQEQLNRAEAAEHEISELKRKMREPDEQLMTTLYDAYHSRRASLPQAWIAGVKHLLGEKE